MDVLIWHFTYRIIIIIIVFIRVNDMQIYDKKAIYN